MLQRDKHLRFVDYDRYEQIVEPIEKATEKIKKTILVYALLMWSYYELRQQIKKIVDELSNELKEIIPSGYLAYSNALLINAINWCEFYYNRLNSISKTANKDKDVKTPKEATENIAELDKEKENEEENEYSTDESSFQYGIVDIDNYEDKINEYIKELAEEEATTTDSASKISLRAKAEIDIRQEAQQKMVNDLIANGDVLCWFSSHADCSTRCEKWQGKLCHLTLPAIDKNMWTGKKDKKGRKIYSFQAITNQVDKYGYKNNIIVGFNCRHRLIPYGDGEKPEDDYSGDDIAKYRKINEQQRKMERTIRKLVDLYKLARVNNPKKAKKIKVRIKVLYKQYIEFSKKYNRPYYPERCGVVGISL